MLLNAFGPYIRAHFKSLLPSFHFTDQKTKVPGSHVTWLLFPPCHFRSWKEQPLLLILIFSDPYYGTVAFHKYWRVLIQSSELF